MKMRTHLMALLFTISLIYCGLPTGEHANITSAEPDTTHGIDTTAESYKDMKFMRPPNGPELKKYALDVLAGKQNPGDNLFTYAMFDSLCSPNAETRKFYSTVYMYCLSKTDGAVSESMGVYLLNYLELYPAEALTNYTQLNGKKKETYEYYLAFEFYATPIIDASNYKPEIQKYFDGIRKKFHSESKLLPTINKLENTILKLAGELISEDAK